VITHFLGQPVDVIDSLDIPNLTNGLGGFYWKSRVYYFAG